MTNTKRYYVIPPLLQDTFDLFRKLIHEKTSINMREGKQILVANRLRKRIFALNLKSYEEYYRYLTKSKYGTEEFPFFIDAVSTNETYFFRGDNHFDVLQKIILPELFKQKSTIGVWSAGCSTGEEPYTIRIIIDNTAGISWKGEVRIIATDISADAIEKAKEGVYGERSLRFVPPKIKERYFMPLRMSKYQVGEKARKGIRFRTHNLLRDEPPGHGFDLIFCRNVMIYFDKPTQKQLVDGIFAKAIAPDGYLFIGHSESICATTEKFKFIRLLKVPVYKRV